MFRAKCLYSFLFFFKYSSVNLVNECVGVCLLGAVSSEERGKSMGALLFENVLLFNSGGRFERGMGRPGKISKT